MSRFTKGTRVVAVKDIHRVLTGESVSQGSTGVVTEGGFLNRAQVEFTIEDFLSDSRVVIDVDDDEIQPG